MPDENVDELLGKEVVSVQVKLAERQRKIRALPDVIAGHMEDDKDLIIILEEIDLHQTMDKRLKGNSLTVGNNDSEMLGHHATSRTTHRRQRLRRRRLAMSRHLLLARQCQTCQPKATESTTRPPRTTTYHSICSRKNCDHCSLVLSDCFNQT